MYFVFFIPSCPLHPCPGFSSSEERGESLYSRVPPNPLRLSFSHLSRHLQDLKLFPIQPLSIPCMALVHDRPFQQNVAFSIIVVSLALALVSIMQCLHPHGQWIFYLPLHCHHCLLVIIHPTHLVCVCVCVWLCVRKSPSLARSPANRVEDKGRRRISHYC